MNQSDEPREDADTRHSSRWNGETQDTQQTPREGSHPARDDGSSTPARRRFLQVVAGGIALGVAGCSSSSGGNNANNKISKQSANYQDSPHNGDQCSGCQFFLSSKDGSNAGKCQKVKGKIDSDAWCRLFSPK